MEPLSHLVYLAEPSCVALILTALFVVLASAHRALTHEFESEKNRDLSDNSIVLDGPQALFIPVMSSISLVLMFYLFSAISQFITGFTAVASVYCLAFCVSPFHSKLIAALGMSERPSNRSASRIQILIIVSSISLVVAWVLSGHWLLNNVLGVALCVSFVSHVRLPNIKICAILLSCLFFYDIFWVFFSERFFGANVMVTVATKQVHNPVHTVAKSLHIPIPEAVSKKLDLPVKLLFPRNLLYDLKNPSNPRDYMMLGLGDMAIPGMLMAFVLCYEHRKFRSKISSDQESNLVRSSPLSKIKRSNYLTYSAIGYAIGLLAALAAGVLFKAAQPALLYLVPSTLGPVALRAWQRKEFLELWNGPKPDLDDKDNSPV